MELSYEAVDDWDLSRHAASLAWLSVYWELQNFAFMKEHADEVAHIYV